MYRQLAFYQANDKTLFDVKRLIYSLLIVERKGRYSNNLVVDEALKTIFKEQFYTGLLPICHVVNNDFVIENHKIKQREVSAVPLLLSFECYNDMLSAENLKNNLRGYHERFRLAYDWAKKRLRKNPVNAKDLLGWYPEYESTHEPESWVTSHILLFLKKYCEWISKLACDNALKYFNVKKNRR